MKLTDLIQRVIDLRQAGDTVLATKRSAGMGVSTVNMSSFHSFRTATLSFLKLSYGINHPYYENFNSKVQSAFPVDVERGIGILNAVQCEMEGGWLVSTKGIVSAEIFSDFLEMSEHLLEMNYKDPAAVLIGSVLEEHLRQLCQKNSIDTHLEKNGKIIPKKADLINADLSKAQVYNILDQKAVTSWLDLRNKAAHGHHTEYDKRQVEIMYQSVIDFMVRNTI
jgi:hypothetical protein